MTDAVTEPESDLLYYAWTVIANAGGGDWTTETPEWQGAAKRWRDRFHAHLDATRVQQVQETT